MFKMRTEVQGGANHRENQGKSIRGRRSLKNQCPVTRKSLECSKNLQKADVAELFLDTVCLQACQLAGG